MARNQPFDFSEDEDLGITSRTTGPASSMGTSSSSDDITASGSSSTPSSMPGQTGMGDISGMSDAELLGDSAENAADLSHRSKTSGPAGAESSQQASKAAQKAAQQTQTAARSSSGQHDSPTSMQHKRGNQPR